MLVTGLVSPLAVAVNETHLYWIDQGKVFGQSALRRASKAGFATETLAAGLGGPWPLALDASYVYWGGDYGTDRMPLDGGATEHLSKSASYVGMALDADHAYWANYHSAGRFLKSGGGDESLATLAPDGPNDVASWCAAVDDTSLYWAVYIGSVWSVPKTGGTPKRLTQNAEPNRCLVADGDYLYVATDQGIHRVRKDGSSDEVISMEPGAEVAVDATSVYWGNRTGIWRWSKH